MAQSDADSGTETTKINLRLSERLLAEADEMWEERGYNSRSEFIRQAIRDSVHSSRLSAQTLESLLISEQQRERDDTVSSAEMRERYGTDSSGE
jgi:metal-responsive CopG/Arc/MetJ family transcriptional regulator